MIANANAETVEHVFGVDVHDFMFQGEMIEAVMLNGAKHLLFMFKKGIGSSFISLPPLQFEESAYIGTALK
jgi:hypothetical protein